MRQKLLTMLAMQDSMNTKVHPQWSEQNFEWYRAVWIECAELMDHQGYKWWKKQTPDLEQVQLEVIDIWHFGMSALFAHYDSPTDIADAILSAWSTVDDQQLSVHQATEELAAWCLMHKSFSAIHFWRLLVAVDLDFDRLFVAYVGKNVLNFFRQDHGYKDGTYIKIWNGKEDNEHLIELTAELDTDSDSFRDNLYHALSHRYQQLTP